MKELKRFTAYDSRGGRYQIVEYQTASGNVYRTEDGYEVEELDRTNLIIHKRNSRTHESFIEAHR